MAGPPPAATDTQSWLNPRSERQGLQRYVDTIRERLGLITAAVLITTLASVAYVLIAPKKYVAHSYMLVTPVASDDPDLVGLPVIRNSNDPTRDVLTATKLVTTTDVASTAADRLNLKTKPLDLLQKIDATPIAQSNIVDIAASQPTARKAERLANAFAEATIVTRTAALHRALDAVLPALRARVQQQPVNERNQPGSLGQRLASLEILRVSPDPTVRVETLAQLPEHPSSPRKKLSIIAGILAGLVIGLGSAFGFQALDPRLRREDQIRELFRLPIIARVPRLGGRRRSPAPLPPGTLTAAAREAYRTLRTTLSSPSFGGAESRVIFVTGSSPSEGKTTTAINLACSLASSGSLVILIEADLRRPTVGLALGAEPRYGIETVLLGQVELGEALVTTEQYGENLSLLLVGQSGAHLADRLALPSATAMVEEARRMADFVIIDSPPLTEVVDALPLAQIADVVIVARLGRSRLNKLTELGDILIQHGIRPIGIALVGVERSDAEYAYYGREEPQQSSRQRRRRGSDETDPGRSDAERLTTR
jgi:receptor protein-tyrosine kinase